MDTVETGVRWEQDDKGLCPTEDERLVVNGQIVARVQYWWTRGTWWCCNKEFISRDVAKQYAEERLIDPWTTEYTPREGRTK